MTHHMGRRCCGRTLGRWRRRGCRCTHGRRWRRLGRGCGRWRHGRGQHLGSHGAPQGVAARARHALAEPSRRREEAGAAHGARPRLVGPGLARHHHEPRRGEGARGGWLGCGVRAQDAYACRACASARPADTSSHLAPTRRWVRMWPRVGEGKRNLREYRRRAYTYAQYPKAKAKAKPKPKPKAKAKAKGKAAP